jgi:hypothetical protein
MNIQRNNPLRVELDSVRGEQAVVRDLLNQALEQDKGIGQARYANAVLQHLVGARLDCALGPGHLEHNSFSDAGPSDGRTGDFFIGDVAIHVTTSPDEAAIYRCRKTLDNGYRPLLVTLARRVADAEALAQRANLMEQIDIFEAEQFLALNIYSPSQARRTALSDILRRYNEIVDEVETDPSLKIVIQGRA